jgi:site-specific DNA recombinase
MVKTSKLIAADSIRKGVVYARVSSKEQEKEGFSIPAQLKLLKDYAAAQGIAVAKEYVDVETAKQTGRGAFGEMIAHLKAQPSIRVLLVEKTDRLYRNLKDWVTVDDLEAEIHFVKEGVVLSRGSRSSEKFMHGIKVLMAKNYIDNLSEEARKGMQEKAEQGIWPTVAPLGYRNVAGADGKKIIEPDPESAPIISRIFEWYGTGTLSLKEAAQKARAAGLVYRKSGAPVPVSTVHATPRYATASTWVSSSSGRSGWPTRQEASPREARFCVFGADRVRPMRVFDRRRDQEAALRLLPLHRLRRKVSERARALPAQIRARRNPGDPVHRAVGAVALRR